MSIATGEEKAALLLARLPAPLAENVLARLAPEQGGRLRAQMQRFDKVQQPRDVVQQVLREFDDLLRIATREPGPSLRVYQEAAAQEKKAPAVTKSDAPKPPDVAPARREERETPQNKVVEPVALGDPLTALKQFSPDQLAAALQGEHTRTVSLVLNCLDAEPAGEVLKRLSPETRREASVHLGRATSGSVALLQRVAQAVVQKCQTLSASPQGQSGDARVKKMADMLRLLDKTDRTEVLTALEQHDSEIAAMVKDLLYQFEDLLAIEDRSMQKLLAEIESKELALALKGAPDAIKEKVLNNLSKRARDTLNEELEFLGFVPGSQIQEAQKRVTAVIQRLDQAGDLVMRQ